MLINCRGRLIDLTTPKVMGILNVTPDSFFDGGRYGDTQSIVRHTVKMVEEGATFIDVGGQSTRPGAKRIEVEEEWSRIKGVLRELRKESEVVISVDTFYSEVARRSVAEGADMINDVSGGTLDAKMFETMATLNVPYVLMHIKGTPETMQENPRYDNVVMEVMDYFVEKTEQLRASGVVDIILDPGFGFGKTPEHNYELLSKLDLFIKLFNRPVLAGLSRKSMVTKVLEIGARQALNGTTVLNTVALLKGASILRVHDVKECMEAIRLTERLTLP